MPSSVLDAGSSKGPRKLSTWGRIKVRIVWLPRGGRMEWMKLEAREGVTAGSRDIGSPRRVRPRGSG